MPRVLRLLQRTKTTQSTDDQSMYGGLYLGCPQWVHRQWHQSIFPAAGQSKDALKYYGQIFNTVEGNTTFYATPSKSVITRWTSVLPHQFRLVLKLPQDITHQRLLGDGALDLTLKFLEHMSPLGERLSYTLIQLPARFDHQYFDTLYRFLVALPRLAADGSPRHYAVELRAPILAQVQQPSLFEEVNALLSSTRTERVWMDTRPLRAADKPWDEPTRLAMRRKPNLPVYPIGLGPSPMVRYVAHPQIESNRPWLNDWADVFCKWLNEGRRPFFFAHYPGETLAPHIARLFYELLTQKLTTLPPRPIWPSEKQMSLF